MWLSNSLYLAIDIKSQVLNSKVGAAIQVLMLTINTYALYTYYHHQLDASSTVFLALWCQVRIRSFRGLYLQK